MIPSQIVYWCRLVSWATCPRKSHDGDAGWDLTVCGNHSLQPGELKDVDTGIAVAIPVGFYGHIIGRSSAQRNHGLEVTEAVVDSGYRGSLFIQVRNVGTEWAYVQTGERLAQIIILPVPTVYWQETMQLPPSSRGTSGFGSTGR